jgi:uncharacterized protein (TIGR01244 family)
MKHEKTIKASTIAPERYFNAFPISEQVVLAGQPQPADWSHLVAEGFHTIVNIRADRERGLIEGHYAEAAGLSYIHLPLPAGCDFEADHVARFSHLLQPVSQEKIIFHCCTGWRVGLLWILHRMINEEWTLEEAITELRALGYHNDDIRRYKFYVPDFFEREEEKDDW